MWPTKESCQFKYNVEMKIMVRKYRRTRSERKQMTPENLRDPRYGQTTGRWVRWIRLVRYSKNRRKRSKVNKWRFKA